MIVQLDSLDTAYFILRNFDDSDFSNDIDDRILSNGFKYDSATLKSPLSEVGIYFKRSPGRYSVIAHISSEDENVLLKGGENLAEKLKKQGYNIFPKNRNSDSLEGYIDLLNHTDLNKGARFSIQMLHSENLLIGISIGSFGSIPLSFPSEETEFIRSVKSLEKLTNIFIENIYETNLVCLDNFPKKVYLGF